MHAADVLFYGNRTLLSTVAKIPDSEWDTPNVCGWWSTREIVAHLSSHEQVLVEVLSSFLTNDATPTLDRFKSGPAEFNDREVEKRHLLTSEQVLAEYNEAHARTIELIKLIPEEVLRQTGRLPWYGSEYDLEDFIAYGFYGHKREHSAQINVFRDELEKTGKLEVTPD
jgi:DinB superfamily